MPSLCALSPYWTWDAVLGLGSEVFPHAMQYVGIDLAIESLAFAARRFGSRARAFVCARGEHIPLPESSFQAALALDVVEHMTKPEMLSLLHEVYRVMKPGAILCLTTPDGRMNFAKRLLGRTHARSHVLEYSPREMPGYLSSAGFSGVTVAALRFPDLPDSKPGAVFNHMLAENPWAFSIFERVFRRLGYGKYVFVARK